MMWTVLVCLRRRCSVFNNVITFVSIKFGEFLDYVKN